MRKYVVTEVPVERVRTVPEEHVEQETVRGQVRKERMDADIPDDARGHHRRREDRG